MSVRVCAEVVAGAVSLGARHAVAEANADGLLEPQHVGHLGPGGRVLHEGGHSLCVLVPREVDLAVLVEEAEQGGAAWSAPAARGRERSVAGLFSDRVSQ